MQDQQLVTTGRLATELGVHIMTLAAWRMIDGKGPPFVKVGSSVRYRRSDIEAWLDAQTRTSTTGTA